MITQEQPTGAPSEVPLCCPQCSAEFHRKRKNQMYCNRDCAKAATRNATRQSRTVKDNPSAKRICEDRSGRCKNLSVYFYETPPAYRAEYLEKLIVEGRKVKELRTFVTTRALLKSWSRGEGTGRLHIAHLLDHYCQEVYRMRSFEVLNPANVLPCETDIVFPAEYFGPEAMPVYEGGTLKHRPCPWGNRNCAIPANRPSTTIKGKFKDAA